jgi:hypothetical protein
MPDEFKFKFEIEIDKFLKVSKVTVKENRTIRFKNKEISTEHDPTTELNIEKMDDIDLTDLFNRHLDKTEK